MKKTVLLMNGRAILSGLLLIGIALGVLNAPGAASEPQAVKMENKVVLSDGLLITKAAPPSMETNVRFATLIVKGKIETEPRVETQEMLSGTGADEGLRQKGGLPQLTFTLFEVKVSKAIYGEAKEKTITVRMMGDATSGMTKPVEGDKVVLFLSECEDGTYVTADLEHSVLTVDDSNRLYSFSNTQELSKYDGSTYEKIERDIYQELAKQHK